MNNENYISEEAFEELVNGLECIESFTLYGRKSLKYHIKRLQEENQKLKNQISDLECLVESIKLGVTLNQKQEKLLDKILFRNDK